MFMAGTLWSGTATIWSGLKTLSMPRSSSIRSAAGVVISWHSTQSVLHSISWPGTRVSWPLWAARIFSAIVIPMCLLLLTARAHKKPPNRTEFGGQLDEREGLRSPPPAKKKFASAGGFSSAGGQHAGKSNPLGAGGQA